MPGAFFGGVSGEESGWADGGGAVLVTLGFCDAPGRPSRETPAPDQAGPVPYRMKRLRSALAARAPIRSAT